MSNEDVDLESNSKKVYEFWAKLMHVEVIKNIDNFLNHHQKTTIFTTYFSLFSDKNAKIKITNSNHQMNSVTLIRFSCFRFT